MVHIPDFSQEAQDAWEDHRRYRAEELDAGLSPYPAMVSWLATSLNVQTIEDGVAEEVWCKDLVAAGPSPRLDLLARQALEADLAADEDDGGGRRDHLKNLIIRCCRVGDTRPAWCGASAESIASFHAAALAAASDYVVKVGTLAYMVPIVERIDAHRDWVLARPADTVPER